MNALQTTIKKIQASLLLQKKGELSPTKSKMGIRDVIINRSQLPSFSYGKFSLNRQKKRQKIKTATLRTLPSEFCKGREDSFSLFRNETIKECINIDLGVSHINQNKQFLSKNQRLIKQRIILQGETIKSVSLFINSHKNDRFQPRKTTNHFQKEKISTRYGNFRLDDRIRNHSAKKQSESYRLRSERSFNMMSRESSKLKMSSQNVCFGMNSLIICQKNNPLNFKDNAKRKMIKHSRSFEEESHEPLDYFQLTTPAEDSSKSNIKICFSNKKKKSSYHFQNAVKVQTRDDHQEIVCSELQF